MHLGLQSVALDASVHGRRLHASLFRVRCRPLRGANWCCSDCELPARRPECSAVSSCLGVRELPDARTEADGNAYQEDHTHHLLPAIEAGPTTRGAHERKVRLRELFAVVLHRRVRNKFNIDVLCVADPIT